MQPIILGNKLGAHDWTPDGDEIIFLQDGVGDEILRVSVDGGEPRLIRQSTRAQSVAVSPSGNEVAYSQPDGLFIVPMRGGKPKEVPGIRGRANGVDWEPKP